MRRWNIFFAKKRVLTLGIVFALVAAGAFYLGMLAGGSANTASIVSKIPLIGDGLNSAPDQNADMVGFWKAWNTLQNDFVITHASTSLPDIKKKVYGAIQGLANSYDDPYTVFLPPEESKAFAESISGSFAGVGMEIDVKNGILTVVAPLKGTPAEAAGIRSGDLIIAIDGKSTDGMAVDAAVARIRGPEGTKVVLNLVREKKQLEISVTRAIIQVPETDDGLDSASGVYHIALFEFTSNSHQLFAAALNRFLASGSDKLVIDLRGNPGGYLDVAVDIASHFLPKGSDVVTEDFGDKKEKAKHTSIGYMDVPANVKIVVLVNGGSASASEIVAGALKDHKVATIIGTRSFGKGSVQELVPLDGGSLKITVARWVTPAGTWIMGNGITPDIVVDVTEADIAAKTDPQMLRAVDFLTTGK